MFVSVRAFLCLTYSWCVYVHKQTVLITDDKRIDEWEKVIGLDAVVAFKASVPHAIPTSWRLRLL